MKIWKIALGKIAAAAATAADKKCASYASAVRKSVRNEFPAIWSPKLPLGESLAKKMATSQICFDKNLNLGF